jgi:hypothetical protein
MFIETSAKAGFNIKVRVRHKVLILSSCSNLRGNIALCEHIISFLVVQVAKVFLLVIVCILISE